MRTGSTRQRNGNERPPLGYVVSTWAVSKAPHRLLGWAAQVGGLVQYCLSAKKRRHYLANTATVVSFDRKNPPWRAFQNHALNVLELLKAASESDDAILRRVRLHGAEHLDRALEEGRGVILATFHLGNWELSGLMLALEGYPISTIAGEQLRPGWSEQVKALKERFGIKMLGSDARLRELYRDLTSNRAVALHLDGDIFAGGYAVPFLGRTVRVPRGPAHLSRVLSAPVALTYCRRSEGNRLDVYVEPALHPPTGEAEERRLTGMLVSAMEKCILADPGQWCIFRKLQNAVD